MSSRVERLLENPVLGPEQGESVQMGGLGVRFMIGGEEADGGFALVEHPIAPKALGAPVHTHANEDEYSYVLEGTVGLQLGDARVHQAHSIPGVIRRPAAGSGRRRTRPRAAAARRVPSRRPRSSRRLADRA